MDIFEYPKRALRAVLRHPIIISRMRPLAISNFTPEVVGSRWTCQSGCMRTLFFLIFFIAAPFSSLLGQNNARVDSLLTVLDKQQNGERYQTLIELTVEFTDHDNSKSYEYIDEANKLALSMADTIKIVQSGRIKGQILRRLDRLNEAMSLFYSLMPIAKRHNRTRDYTAMINSLAIALTDRGEYHKALEFHYESLELREQSGNKFDISIGLLNIGQVHYKLKDYLKAIQYFEKSLELKRESGEESDTEYTTLANLGHCYRVLNFHDKAREYYETALKRCGDNCNVDIQMDAECGLGLTFLEEGDYEVAKKHIKRSLAVARRSNDKNYLASNLDFLAKIALDKQLYDSAVQNLEAAEQYAQEAGYNSILVDIYRDFSKLYKETEDFKKAAYYQDKYIQLKDSVFSEELIKNIAAVQTRLEERENIKTIAVQGEQLTKQRTLNIAIVIIAVLATLLVFMLFRSNVAKRKANDRLDKEVKAATKDLQAANQLLAEVNQELDHFIYKTSHDIRGPLATLKGLCNVALVDVADSTALKYLNKLDLTATQLDTLLRRLQKVNQVNNASLLAEPIDFGKILGYVELVEKRKGLPPRLTIKKEVENGISYSSDRELVTLIHENLNANAEKFYDTSERIDPFVKIIIEQKDTDVIIRVIDNGIGIGEVHPEELFHLFARASERSVSGGIGLYLSRRATQKLGGKIDLHSTPEGHTEVIVTLPISNDFIDADALQNASRA